MAARWSDVVVLTSDNPRSEDPMAIIDQVRAGIVEAGGAGGRARPGRGHPRGRREAGPGDVVLVAGKGHETTQVLADGC